MMILRDFKCHGYFFFGGVRGGGGGGIVPFNPLSVKLHPIPLYGSVGNVYGFKIGLFRFFFSISCRLPRTRDV